jgi:hypothetical protein
MLPMRNTRLADSRLIKANAYGAIQVRFARNSTSHSDVLTCTTPSKTIRDSEKKSADNRQAAEQFQRTARSTNDRQPSRDARRVTAAGICLQTLVAIRLNAPQSDERQKRET